jgi:arginase
VRNGAAIAAYSARLGRAIGAEVGRGHFCVVLGGDGSILLGARLALRRRGRYGLLFIMAIWTFAILETRRA